MRYIEIELHVLTAIADPNIALLLIVIGAFGVYAECSSPGMILPGVAGASLALLGLAALYAHPLDGRGASLILLGLIVIASEARLRTRGWLTAVGAIALVPGLALLIRTPDPAQRIHFGTAAAAALPFGLITSFLLSVAGSARRNKRMHVDMLNDRESESQS